ncbi:MAG: hypothetical protein U0798_03735 [Gemmataceae bacterium]
MHFFRREMFVMGASVILALSVRAQQPAPINPFPVSPAVNAAPVVPLAPVIPLPPASPATPVFAPTPVSQQQQPPPRDPTERPIEPSPANPEANLPVLTAETVLTAPPPFDPPLGYTGRSRIVPRSGSNEEFVTVEDRWRQGFPEWDRTGLNHPHAYDYPYVLGRWWDPYNTNVLKGDVPIYGQHTFFNLTASTTSLVEARQVPTATTPFESTERSGERDFFGRPNQIFYTQPLFVSFDLSHGDAAFKPADWRIKVTPAFNMNYLSVSELGVVSPDVRRGSTRARTWGTLQEWFVERKLFDIGPEYDFMSVRVGSQPFTSDFRGFIFSDTNRGVRLFGTLEGNRDQYNLAVFRQQEKETNSGLNTFEDRNQTVIVGNFYRQDFLFPGYTIEGSVHYNNDGPDLLYDRNLFLVRPDPVGVYKPHRVESTYLGIAGDGHIGRFNLSHAFYWALGRDTYNPIAGQSQSISAQMAALEVSYDRDWARFRVSGMWASGDGNPNNSHATGFDSILDNTNFAGENSFWNRQQIALFGVNLVQRNSLFTDLRSSKLQGQSNFVNPGVQLINMGVDFDVTPRFRVVNNVNFLWFDKTASLETFVFQNDINRHIGTDFSTSVEYRPLLNNICIIQAGVSTLLPGSGFRELYNRLGEKVNPLVAGFIEVTMTY